MKYFKPITERQKELLLSLLESKKESLEDELWEAKYGTEATDTSQAISLKLQEFSELQELILSL